MQRPGEQSQPPLAKPNAATLIGVLLCGLALWLLVRPYYGITHDALLYAATALSRLDPAAFAKDFYLTRNASDAYSLFPNLYALAIERLGLDAATRGLLQIGLLAWIGGAATLCTTLLRGHAGLLAILLLCGLPARYGSFDILAYGEPYLTPRLFAEACCLFALAALLRRRWLPALALLGAAGLLHPLMTLPALGVALFFLAQQDRRWLWLIGAGLALAAALAVAGLPPFDRLLRTIDADWLAIVRFRAPYLFLDSWSYWNWANLAIDVTLVALAAIVLTGSQRRLMLAVLATAVTAYLCSAVAVDFAHNLLITQLQPWRVGWLLRVFAFIALAEILFDARRRAQSPSGDWRIFLLFALAALTLALQHRANLMAVCTLAILLLAMPAYLAQLRHRPLPGGRMLGAVGISVSLGLTLVTLATAVGHSVAWRTQLADSGLSLLMANEFAMHWLAVLVLVLLSWWLLFPGPLWRRGLAVAATGTALMVAVFGWDRRSDWSRHQETLDIDVTQLRLAIEPGETVYWERSAAMPWFVLRRPNFFSPTQGSGIVFDRAAAMIYDRRRRLLAPLGTDDTGRPFVGGEARDGAGRRPTARSVARVCADSAGPDHLILGTSVDGLPATPWQPPVPAPIFVFRDGGYSFRPVRTFFHFDCAIVRANITGQAAG